MSDVLDQFQDRLSTSTDAEIAALANVAVGQVKAWRRQQRVNVALAPMRDTFASTPVTKIAQVAGVSRDAVTAFAEREGLPRYTRRRSAPPTIVDGRPVDIMIDAHDLSLLGSGTPAEIVRAVIEADDPTNDPLAAMMRAAEQAVANASGDAVALNARCRSNGVHVDGDPPCNMCRMSERARALAAKLSEQMVALTSVMPSQSVRVRLPAPLLERVDAERAKIAAATGALPPSRATYVEGVLRRALARVKGSGVHRAMNAHLDTMEQNFKSVLDIVSKTRAMLTD